MIKKVFLCGVIFWKKVIIWHLFNYQNNVNATKVRLKKCAAKNQASFVRTPFLISEILETHPFLQKFGRFTLQRGESSTIWLVVDILIDIRIIKCSYLDISSCFKDIALMKWFSVPYENDFYTVRVVLFFILGEILEMLKKKNRLEKLVFPVKSSAWLYASTSAATIKAFTLALWVLPLWLPVSIEVSKFKQYHQYLSSVSLCLQKVYPNTWILWFKRQMDFDVVFQYHLCSHGKLGKVDEFY